MSDKMGKHKSLDKELKLGVKWLTEQPEIKRVILGLAEAARTKFPPGFFRYQRDVVGGILINGYGGTGVIKITLIIEEGKKDAVLQKLKEKFGER
jgi:hypothetical protein